MAQLINAMKKIWKLDEDFCCFCFLTSPDPLIHMEDQIYVIVKETETLTPMSEILCTVLDFEVLDYMTPFKQICKRCTQSAVNSYVFIKTTKINSEHLTNAISSLLNSLKNDYKSSNYDTVFLALNTENFITNHFYDVRKTKKHMPTPRKRCIPLQNDSRKSQSQDLVSHKDEIIPIRTKDILNDDESIKCKVCLKSYSSLLFLRNHYIRIHAPKIFKCHHCNKGFGSPKWLEIHKSDYHRSFVCSKCGKTIKSKHKLKTHEMSHNSRIVCPDCGRAYKNEMTYKKHINLNVCIQKTRASPTNAKFTCDYCKKRYTQKTSLRVHIQSEHLTYKNHDCKVCNKKFWAQSRLKAHIVKHTKERNFVCTVCNGKFVTKESLLYHTRIHTGEKPYECSGCQARFLSSSRRAEHVKRQHLNATIECDVCHDKFSTLSYLQKHKRSHLQCETNNLSSNVIINTIKSTEYLKKITDGLTKHDSTDLMKLGTYHFDFSQVES